MSEYWIVTKRCGAPCGITNSQLVTANDHETALAEVVKNFAHPAGLCSAVVYQSITDRNREENRLGEWLSKVEIARREKVKEFSVCTSRIVSASEYQVDGMRYTIEEKIILETVASEGIGRQSNDNRSTQQQCLW